MKLNREAYWLLTPYFLVFLAFTVLPVLMAAGLSLTEFNILESPRWVGWSNYSRLFLDDDTFIKVLQNTFLFVLITGPFGYILCFLVAWMINDLKPRMRSVVTLAFYMPTLAGAGAFTIWRYLFSGARYGMLNAFLLQTGIVLEPVLWLADPVWILPIIILVQLWMSLGTSFLSFIAGLQTVDRSLYEAAAIDGVRNRWQELWFITLPVMRPYLLFGAVMQIQASFAAGAISMNLIGFPTPNYAGDTIVTHLVDYGQVRFEMGYASAIAVFLFTLMVTFNKSVQRFIKRFGS
jgi:multiple sugar transport system permease protein